MSPFRSSTTGLAFLLAVTPVLAGDRPAAAGPAITQAHTPAHALLHHSEEAEPSAGHTSAAPRFPLHFTAPADAHPSDASDTTVAHSEAVRGYDFLQIDAAGKSTRLVGYADSLGDAKLAPHRPGVRETVWLETTEAAMAKTIFVLSRGWSGRQSARSNGVAIAAVLDARSTTTPRSKRLRVAAPGVSAR